MIEPRQGESAIRSGRLGVAADVLRGRRQIYHGWWILICSVVAMALGSGLSFWSFGLYYGPLQDRFGWSKAEVSLGVSFSLAASGIAGPVIGRWIDAHGPRSAILFGGILTALSFLPLAATHTLWHWYAFSVLNAVCRQMMFFIPFQALVSRWFDRRRGLAMSIFGTGFSLGGFVIVPALEAVIAIFGWRVAFVLSGAATALVYVPIAVFVIHDHPHDLGLLVDGEAPTEQRPQPSAATGLTLSQAVRTPVFWLISFGMMFLLFGMFGFLVHQVPYWESEGLSSAEAAALVSATAGLGVFARLGMGQVADRIPRFELAIATLCFLLICGTSVLLVSSSWPAIAMFLLFWSLGNSAGPLNESLLISRAFGLANFATILGAVVVVETIGQVISPSVAGLIFDSTGSYHWALVMFVGAWAASAVLFVVASRMKTPIQALAAPVAAVGEAAF